MRASRSEADPVNEDGFDHLIKLIIKLSFHLGCKVCLISDKRR
jgi:hypothetical protein